MYLSLAFFIFTLLNSLSRSVYDIFPPRCLFVVLSSLMFSSLSCPLFLSHSSVNIISCVANFSEAKTFSARLSSLHLVELTSGYVSLATWYMLLFFLFCFFQNLKKKKNRPVENLTAVIEMIGKLVLTAVQIFNKNKGGCCARHV